MGRTKRKADNIVGQSPAGFRTFEHN